MNIYGSVISNSHTDTSKTELGAKQYATRHGLDNVSVRFGCGYVVYVVARKLKGKWVGCHYIRPSQDHMGRQA